MTAFEQNKDKGADRRGIQSVEIGMRVLEALNTAGGPLPLTDVARAAELPTSNCHRYLVSFVRTGFVTQDALSGRYDLGPRMLQGGLSALARIDVTAIATEAMARLVDATGHSGQLTIWADAGPTIIRWMPGRMAVRTSLSMGSALPLLTSATGRVFLAYLPARQTGALLAREQMAGAEGDPDTLIKSVRATGLGHVSGEHIPGLSAIAAPVLNAYGEAAAVITLVGGRQGIVPGASEHLLLETRDASARLGWTAPSAAGIA